MSAFAAEGTSDKSAECGGEGEEGLDYDGWNGLDIIESLCINCREQGTTILKLHKVPFFKELIIASFSCPHCRYSNNEVSFGGEIQVQGSVVELEVAHPDDLNRQIIKSDTACVRIPEIDFEIPPQTQKGEITTLEGILMGAAKNLGMYQRERLVENPEVGLKVAEIIMKLTQMAGGDLLPFILQVDDPAGNSFIENPQAPTPDPRMKISSYPRTDEQDLALGLQPSSMASKVELRGDEDTNYSALAAGTFGQTRTEQPPAYPVVDDGETVRLGKSFGQDEPFIIPAPCPNCSKEGESMTAITTIPHFKEVIIMGFSCSFCGFRTNEVRGGGAIPTLGTTVTLSVTSADDLKRDVLKSDSAMVTIPELDLELAHGTLGGVYTTVEGLMQKIFTNLRDNNPFAVGDASTNNHSQTLDTNPRFMAFLDKLQSYGRGEELPFTLEIRDPLGNSFISAPLGTFLPPEADANLHIVDFERSFEENDDFGLNDINTRDFETGYENQDESASVLPDRLTHISVKGADHPTPFATGTVDATPGGVFFGGNNKGNVGASNSSSSDGAYEVPPEGYSAAKSACNAIDAADAEQTWTLPADYSKRKFKDDSALANKFLPRDEFSGRKPGLVFRLGSLGLGYYPDEI
jgi:zinc finger protein